MREFKRGKADQKSNFHLTMFGLESWSLIRQDPIKKMSFPGRKWKLMWRALITESIMPTPNIFLSFLHSTPLNDLFFFCLFLYSLKLHSTAFVSLFCHTHSTVLCLTYPIPYCFQPYSIIPYYSLKKAKLFIKIEIKKNIFIGTEKLFLPNLNIDCGFGKFLSTALSYMVTVYISKPSLIFWTLNNLGKLTSSRAWMKARTK